MDNKSYLSKFWIFIIITLTLFSIGYFNHFHKDWPNPNETVRLYLSIAISDRGEFNIDNEITKYGVIWDRAVYKNKTYSDKAPGISFAAVPPLFINKIVHKYILKKSPSIKISYLIAVFSTSVLFTLISIYFLLKLLALYKISFQSTLLSLLALVYGTYLNTYSILFFGHQFSASLLFISFVFIEIYLKENKKPLYIISAAFLSSYAFISEYPTIFISIILLLYLIISSKDLKVILYSLSAIIPVILLMYYLNICFGSIFSTGYQHLDSETFSRIHQEGILGFKYPSIKALFNLTFGSLRGLFFFSPVLLFSVIYFFKYGLKSNFIKLILILSIGYLLLISSFGYWIGGDTAGARHLIPLNYFLIIPLALFLEENQKSPLILSLFFGLLIISVHNVVVTNLSWPFFPPQFLNPLSDFAYILIRDGFITGSIANISGIYSYASAGIYLFVIVLTIVTISIFILRHFYAGYIIAIQIFLIWILFITLLFPSKPDENNFREIKRIEKSFDPKPEMRLLYPDIKTSEYYICIKRGNMLIKNGFLIESLKEYRCKR